MTPDVEENKETQQPPKSSKKGLLIGLLILVVLAGGGAGAYFKFFATAGETEAGSKEQEQAIIKEMDTFIVNLSDPGGKRFLKLTMKAKMDTQLGMNELGARNFEMRDIILMILSAKEYEEISRPEDKLALKQELIGAINRSLRKGSVKEIYFTEFLIQ